MSKKQTPNKKQNRKPKIKAGTRKPLNTSRVLKFEPIFLNHFEVIFENPADDGVAVYLSNKASFTDNEIKMITEQVQNINYSNLTFEAPFGINFSKTCNISFSMNEVDGTIQPLKTLERYRTQKIKFNVRVNVFNKTGDILCIINLIDCEIKGYDNFNAFDYRSDDIADLSVQISYEKADMKLA